MTWKLDVRSVLSPLPWIIWLQVNIHVFLRHFFHLCFYNNSLYVLLRTSYLKMSSIVKKCVTVIIEQVYWGTTYYLWMQRYYMIIFVKQFIICEQIVVKFIKNSMFPRRSSIISSQSFWIYPIHQIFSVLNNKKSFSVKSDFFLVN